MAQDNAFLITYSPSAGITEGDDDFVQIIYFKIPDTITDSIYVRILDADIGGGRDARYGGVWDSETRFQLFGGDSAIPKDVPHGRTLHLPDYPLASPITLATVSSGGAEPVSTFTSSPLLLLSPDSGLA